MKLIKAALAAALLTTSISTSVQAVPLPEGGVVFTNGTSLAENNALGGGVQNDNLVSFSYDPTPVTSLTNVGGDVQNRVVESGVTGTKIFMPRLRDIYNIDGGTFAILGYRQTGFAGFDIDVDYRTDGLGDRGFSSVSRSADGDLMTFRFDDPLVADSINPPGLREESYFASILTDATDYDLSGTMTIFGEILPLGGRAASGVASNLFSIEIAGIAAPTTAVPLPAPLALLGAGLMGLGFVGRRKKA